MNDQILIYGEAADLTRMSTRKLAALVRAGKIPSIRIGRSVRFSRLAIERWLGDLPSAAREPATAS
jgi:excisionase family DNA binding protein